MIENLNPAVTHAQYDPMVQKWARCRDFVSGSDAVKAAGTKYLPALNWRDEANKRYAAYLDRAFVSPATSRAVEASLGTLFRKEPAVVAPDRILPHFLDVTAMGETLLGFAQRAALEVLTVGGFVALLDFGADRPYWVGYRREQVLNWRTGVYNGDLVLTLLVLEECEERPDPTNRFATRTVSRYRVLELDEEGRYIVTVWAPGLASGSKPVAGEPMMPTRRGVPLTFIPAAFINPLGGVNDPTPTKPPLLDLVNANASHYRLSADYRHALHFCGLPQPYVMGYTQNQKEFAIGGPALWTFEGEGAKVGMLECKADSVGALRQALEDLEHVMTSLSVRFATDTVPNETATAAALRHASDTATLSNVAVASSEALTALARWHTWWAGATDNKMDENVLVHLTTDFDAKLVDPRLLTEMTKALQEGAITRETYYAFLERGELTIPGRTFEDEQKALDAEREELEGRLNEEIRPEPSEPPDDSDADEVDAA